MEKKVAPTLAAIGIGEYYRKLRAGLWKQFRPVVLVDVRPEAAEDLSPAEREIFRVQSSSTPLPLLAHADVVVVLSPNHTHVPYVVELCRANRAVIVEKPIAVSLDELRNLSELVRGGARVYFSDAYVDVRSSALFFVLNMLKPDDWRRTVVGGDPDCLLLAEDIGPIQEIRGTLRETYPFASRWIRDTNGGGVILDLMVHLLAVLRALFPDQELSINSVTRTYPEPQSSQPTPTSAEMSATMTGTVQPIGAGIELAVAKQAERDERCFEIIGTHGRVVQQYKRDSQPLEIEVEGRVANLSLTEDHYDLTCAAMRRWLDRGANAYGWEWNAWAVEQALRIREWPANVFEKT